MTDYISREAALKLVENAPILAGNDNESLISAPDLMDEMAFLPTADVRPVVRGEWLLDSDPGEPWRYRCSECGEKTTDTCMGEPRANFCPHCGADMREEKGNG